MKIKDIKFKKQCGIISRLVLARHIEDYSWNAEAKSVIYQRQNVAFNVFSTCFQIFNIIGRQTLAKKLTLPFYWASMLKVTRVRLLEGDELLKKWGLGPGRECSGHLEVTDPRDRQCWPQENMMFLCTGIFPCSILELVTQLNSNLLCPFVTKNIKNLFKTKLFFPE